MPFHLQYRVLTSFEGDATASDLNVYFFIYGKLFFCSYLDFKKNKIKNDVCFSYIELYMLFDALHKSVNEVLEPFIFTLVLTKHSLKWTVRTVCNHVGWWYDNLDGLFVEHRCSPFCSCICYWHLTFLKSAVICCWSSGEDDWNKPLRYCFWHQKYSRGCNFC